MILTLECVAACVLFGLAIVGSTLKNKTAWLHEYAPAVQQRFLECNPDFIPPKKSTHTIGLIFAKIAVCSLFTLVLTGMAYLAGARHFFTGALYSYIIWTVVNIFDVLVLDIGIFAHWKRVRLPGTENMDAEYRSNAGKSIRDGFAGVLIGLPVCALCGWITVLFCQ